VELVIPHDKDAPRPATIDEGPILP